MKKKKPITGTFLKILQDQDMYEFFKKSIGRHMPFKINDKPIGEAKIISVSKQDSDFIVVTMYVEGEDNIMAIKNIKKALYENNKELTVSFRGKA